MQDIQHLEGLLLPEEADIVILIIILILLQIKYIHFRLVLLVPQGVLEEHLLILMADMEELLLLNPYKGREEIMDIEMEMKEEMEMEKVVQEQQMVIMDMQELTEIKLGILLFLRKHYMGVEEVLEEIVLVRVCQEVLGEKTKEEKEEM